MQNLPSKRVYRPVLLERPSMTKFVVLSVLMHIWAIALFGDASDGASRGTSGGWASTFTAKLGQAAQPQVAPSITQSIAKPAKPARDQATPATPAVEANMGSSPLASTASIEPIPVIAVETNNPISNFVVPSLNIAPIDAPQSSATTNFAAIVLPPVIAPIAKTDDNFAIYVPPIIERARVEITEAQPTVAPLPTVAPPMLATKEFDTFKPTLPTPTPSPAPALATVSPQVNPVVTPPVVTVAPIEQIAQIAPIEKIVLPPTTVREFAPAVSTSIVSKVDAPKLDATSVTAARANTSNSVSDKTNAEKAAAAPARGDGASRAAANPNANAGGADGLSSLLPIIPVKPVTPTLDLDKLRQRAREVAVEGSGPRMLLPFPTIAKPAEKRDIEKIFDKALKRPDCKDEYADMGLAAVVPLVRDAIKGTGCKW